MSVPLNAEHEQSRISPQHQQSGGLIPISLENGITPDMKMSTIMALLDIPIQAPDEYAAKKQGMIYQRGSSLHDPFVSTRLYGTDGVMFETMMTEYVATITLY